MFVINDTFVRVVDVLPLSFETNAYLVERVVSHRGFIQNIVKVARHEIPRNKQIDRQPLDYLLLYYRDSCLMMLLT